MRDTFIHPYLVVYNLLLLQGVCVQFSYLAVQVSNCSLASLKINKIDNVLPHEPFLGSITFNKIFLLKAVVKM